MADTPQTSIPAELRPLIEAASAARNTGDLTEALRLLDEAVGRWPGFYQLWSMRGTLQQDLQRPEEALTSFRRSIAIEPSFCDHYNAGNSLLALGRLDEAIREYDASIACDKEQPTAWVNRGICFYHQGRDGDAALSFARALAIQPGFDAALRCDATVAGRQGDQPRARERWRAYCQAHPEDPMAWNQYGFALGDLPPDNRIDVPLHRDAIAAFQRSRQLDPSPVETWGEEGFVRQRLLHALQAMSRAMGGPLVREYQSEVRATLAFFEEALARFPGEERLKATQSDILELVGAR